MLMSGPSTNQQPQLALLKFSQTYSDPTGINDFNLEVNNPLIAFGDFNRANMCFDSYSF